MSLRVFVLAAACLLLAHAAEEAPDAPGEQVDVVFSNDSGIRCDIYWIYNQRHGDYDEKHVKHLLPDEKYVERTFPDQRFVTKCEGKIGDAFVTGADKKQFHSIKGTANQMSHRRKNNGDL